MSTTNYTRNNETPIYVGKRVVGRVRGDTFYKQINFSRHALKTPPALANDVSVLQDAQAAGAVWVEIRDKETGTKYRAKISHIFENGWQFDRGFGRQQALMLDGWIKTGQAIQLGMWG